MQKSEKLILKSLRVNNWDDPSLVFKILNTKLILF